MAAQGMIGRWALARGPTRKSLALVCAPTPRQTFKSEVETATVTPTLATRTLVRTVDKVLALTAYDDYITWLRYGSFLT